MAAITVVAGCSSASGGPVSYSDQGLSWCFLADTYEAAAVGIPIEPVAGSTITITGVETTGRDGLVVEGSYIATVTEKLRFGGESWPLPKSVGKLSPAVGARVAAGEYKDLVLHVARGSAARGTIGDVVIRYESDGRTFVADTYTEIRIDPKCDTDDDGTA